MAASPEVKDNAPVEDLEEGELPSSDEEFEGNDSISCHTEHKDSVTNGSNEQETDEHSTDTANNRKRPFESPEHDKSCTSDTNSDSAKKPKVDDDSQQEDLEEGEIFSDDEEAAYYPQLVKKRNGAGNSQDKESSSSPLKSRSRSGSPYSRDDRPPFFYEDRYGDVREKDTTSKASRYHNQSSMRGQKWRDHDRRGRMGRGSRNHLGSDLIGQPIRHVGNSGIGGGKWDEAQPNNRNWYTPTLTLELIENRLSRCLALLPTPKINQCLSLDEMNYPAPPQWYLKSVAAYNKKQNQKQGLYTDKKEGENEEDGVEKASSVDMLANMVGYQMDEVSPPAAPIESQPVSLIKPVEVHVEPPQQSSFINLTNPNPINSIPPLFTPEDVSATNPLVNSTIPHVTSLENHTTAADPNTANTTSHMTPALSHVTVTEDHVNDTNPTIPTDVIVNDTTITCEPIIIRSRNSRKRLPKRKTRTDPIVFSRRKQVSLIVSIDLSLVHVGDPLHDSTDFNYDDYLNQLNDEEESNDDNYDFAAAAADFWIDTKPSNDINDDESNPLDEDFPTISGIKKTVNRITDDDSLCALVRDKPVDDAIAFEEGKNIPKGGIKIRGGGNSSQRIPRISKKEKQYWTKQQQQHEKELKSKEEDKKEDDTQMSTKPCKYFLNGYCIHGDSCQYSHSAPREKKKEICKFYLQDACDKGDDCLFYHGDFPCKYFYTRHMCYHGDKCKFSHAPLNKESYDILMSVIEPSMREFVQPPHLEPLHMLQLPKVDPNAGILGPIPSQLPLGPRPPIVVQPPLMLPPPQLSPPTIIQPPLPQDGKWLPSHHELSPHPVHMIQPTPANLGGGCVPVMKEEEPLFKSNVPVSSDFDISVLFPDSHPQVLPHELATQLRKVLLPTPTSSDDKTDELELEYWESEEIEKSPKEPNIDNHFPQDDHVQVHIPPNMPPMPVYHEAPPRPHPHPVRGPHPPLRPEILRPPLINPRGPPPQMYPNHPLPPGINGPRSFPHPIYPSHEGGCIPIINHPHPPHREVHMSPEHHILRPDPRAPPHIVYGPTPDPSPVPRQSMIDPRHSRQQYHSPSQQPVEPHRPTEERDTSQYSKTQSESQSNLLSTPYSTPNSIHGVNCVDTLSSESKQGSSFREITNEQADSSSPVWGTASETTDLKNDRLITPRQKYAHLKIKSKNQDSPNLPPSVLKKSGDTLDNKKQSNMPALLQDGQQLEKPLAPQELFGSSKILENISIFGSRQQVPDSPLPNEKQVFGEIKMTTDQQQEEDQEDPLKEETPVIPSYLTHLGLGLAGTEDDEQIESAFGTLQARQRRPSEVSSIISEDTTSQDIIAVSSPSTSKESTLTAMFTFGSSLY